MVDFELALDLDNFTRETGAEAYGYYLARDFGLRLHDLENPARDFETGVIYASPEDLKKSEIRLWALTLVRYILGSDGISTKVELAPEDKEEFDEIKKKISPLLEKEIVTTPEGRIRDDLTQKDLDELSYRTEEELLSITLKEKLKAKGVVIPEEFIKFMSQALSLELDNRPSDFSKLIKV